MPSYLSPGVYVEEVPAATRPIAGVGTAVAGFVGFAPSGPFNEPVLITNWQQYTSTFGDMVEEFAMGKAVYGFLNNGGGRAYIVRIPTGGSGVTPVPVAEIGTKADKAIGSLRVLAVDAAAKGLSVQVQTAQTAEGEEPQFTLTVKQDGKEVESFTGPMGKGKTALATQVNTKSKTVKIEVLDAPAELVASGLGEGTVALTAPATAVTDIEVKAADVIGDSATRTGFGVFETLEDVTMILAPDVVTSHAKGLISLEDVKAIQTGMINHAELMGNRMVILDTPSSLNAQQVADWRQNIAGFDSKFAVMYWPWVNVFDPTVGQTIAFPPSGHVAGIWSRNDDTRGVFKAPANEIVLGSVGVEYPATRGELDMLNPMGVNAIKSFPGRGIRVWGGRTLSSDAEWRYVNVRRYFNYLEESILQGTQWCVFEPNDERLWGRIRRTITAFLVNEWRSGALFGASPAEAFFVKCDGENNTAESIDLGMVICEIGVAPVKPAEFVIFRLSQFSGGTSISE